MSIKVQTDQTGANQNICSGSNLVFNFSLSQNNTLDSANFVIKKGSATTDTIVATIYNQKNGAGTVVASVSVSATNVTQSFTTIIFNFNTNLYADISYSLVVSSSSSCSGSSPYSMKSGNFQVLDSVTNNVINTGYAISSNISANVSTNLSETQTIYIRTSIASLCFSNISAIKQYNIFTNMFCNSLQTSNISYTGNISLIIANNTTLQIQANRILPDSNNHIRIDGRKQQQPIIYLGSKKPKIYHKNRVIVDKG